MGTRETNLWIECKNLENAFHRKYACENHIHKIQNLFCEEFVQIRDVFLFFVVLQERHVHNRQRRTTATKLLQVKAIIHSLHSANPYTS